MKLSKFIYYTKGESQLLLAMPHSGITIPEGIHHHLNLSQPHVHQTIHNGIDYCVPFVSGFHEYSSASKIWTIVSRVVVDVNRHPDNIDEYAVEGCKNESNPHGLIWRSSMETKTENIRDLLTKPYSKEELESLLTEAYYPYINSVKEEMFRLHDLHGRAINFALHSMPNCFPSHVKKGKHKNAYLFEKEVKKGSIEEGKLPDLVLVDGDGNWCNPEISQIVIGTFQKYDYLIERMKIAPSSVTSPRNWVNPEQELHFLGIEVVGHSFEPKRMQGILEYNPKDEARMCAAFKDVFRGLERY